MTKRAFVFPGQGSQIPGMGKLLAESFSSARDVFTEIDETLSQKLSRLIFEGPTEELTLTSNAQPALMAVSIAVLRVLQYELGLDISRNIVVMAGHSLGEYSALCAADSFDLATAAYLLRRRGDAMQKAVPPNEGQMAALMGIALDEVQQLCERSSVGDEVVELANDNGGGQCVISGTWSAVERAMALAREYNVKRVLPLPVSAPFHCCLMKPAAAVMQEELRKAVIRTPVIPIIANVTAAPICNPQDIRSLLVQQVTGTVRWRESILTMVELGIDSVVELGAGKVLAGLVRRIAPEISTMSVATPADIESFAKII